VPARVPRDYVECDLVLGGPGTGPAGSMVCSAGPSAKTCMDTDAVPIGPVLCVAVIDSVANERPWRCRITS
jgi:hypothetical protein